jgi:hypothetical protein
MCSYNLQSFIAGMNMTDNVYAAPLANFDEPKAATSSDDRFYVVSTRKLLILYFMTLGFYLRYWNYKNWALHNKATDEGVWPIPRTIFSVFFQHSLFRNVADHDATGERSPWDAGKYATLMVVLMIASNILWRLSGKGLAWPYVDIGVLLLLLPTGLLLKKVQAEINARCGDASGASNASFSAANIIWCVLGVLVWLLALAGVFIPD